jgi:hypothetical protein
MIKIKKILTVLFILIVLPFASFAENTSQSDTSTNSEDNLNSLTEKDLNIMGDRKGRIIRLIQLRISINKHIFLSERIITDLKSMNLNENFFIADLEEIHENFNSLKIELNTTINDLENGLEREDAVEEFERIVREANENAKEFKTILNENLDESEILKLKESYQERKESYIPEKKEELKKKIKDYNKDKKEEILNKVIGYYPQVAQIIEDRNLSLKDLEMALRAYYNNLDEEGKKEFRETQMERLKINREEVRNIKNNIEDKVEDRIHRLPYCENEEDCLEKARIETIGGMPAKEIRNYNSSELNSS